MSEIAISYGTHGVQILSPAPAVGSGGALLMNNDKALSDAIDNIPTPTLDTVLAAGAVSDRIAEIGSLQVTDSNIAIVPDNLGGQIGTAFQLSNRNTDGPTNVITLHEDAVDSATITLDATGVSNLIIGGTSFSVGTDRLNVDGTEVNTINNTLDDGEGNMIVGGSLTIGGGLTCSSANLVLQPANGMEVVTTQNGLLSVILDDGSANIRVNAVTFLEDNGVSAITCDAGSNIHLTALGTVSTPNNTLDDGGGNIVAIGSISLGSNLLSTDFNIVATGAVSLDNGNITTDGFGNLTLTAVTCGFSGGVNNAQYITFADSTEQTTAYIGVPTLADVTNAGSSTTGAITVNGILTATGVLIASAGINCASGNLALSAHNLLTDTTTGSKIGTATNQKLGFFNATPIVQPSGANQAALTDSTGGTAGTTLAAITAGSSYAQADMVAAKNAIASLARLLNQIRTDLVALGLEKGSA